MTSLCKRCCLNALQSWSAALIRHAALWGAAVGLVHVALALYSRKDVLGEKGWADNIISFAQSIARLLTEAEGTKMP